MANHSGISGKYYTCTEGHTYLEENTDKVGEQRHCPECGRRMDRDE